ncbi:JmjC-domain-containing protein [Basidiobolus meristosporus CBS 931.73]|uniref:[histone H3]-trimethyl-L-lysine(4) demethylase n=1 Tax=Basidiobolus meristosporus CBS 931.73 TaxID=1314790 RepID=A0A1Y1Y629_9FUNG|nr:JmjC-domain-containing protein [Basidiobolus meristosporus CBS 931.73]|eukprot:ORX93156.1 JmjC-domain-containing protein [Basidiobolus meristosporus CBS 931.73]
MKRVRTNVTNSRVSERAPKFDLNTVCTERPDIPPKTKRLFDLEEAPTFYPTEEEFADPLGYIEKIKTEGEKYGICKIVPPKNWKPTFSVDTETFRFNTRIQKLNTLDGKTRANVNYLEQLYKFHRHNGTPVVKVPQLDHKPVDLYRLSKEVAARGGPEKVTKDKKWAEIGRILNYSRKTCTSLSNSLKTIYTKVVLPYETYIESMKKKTDLKRKQDDCPGDMSQSSKDDKSQVSSRPKRGRTSSNTTATSLVTTPPPTPPQIDQSTSTKSLQTPKEESSTTCCHVCKSEDQTALFECDGCDHHFHPSCVDPPLSGVPKGDWYCLDCLNEVDEFGFEDGGIYSLHSFQQKAEAFKKSWFQDRLAKRSYTDVNRALTEDEIEEEFWRLADSPHEDVEVEYGADLHSSEHGSGFATKAKAPNDPYVSNGWNLNVMPVLNDSLLRYIKTGICGMMVPWLYVGMCFSTFCWHTEDHYTYSINYMHWGETKTWYGIPSSEAAKFEETMKKTVPELFEQTPDLLFQLVTIMSPKTLTENGVKVCALDQRAGEFVITFPQGYHAGFSHGLNFGEAVNFCPKDWLPFDLDCALLYKQFKRVPVFSHDGLLVTIANEDHSPDTAKWLTVHLEEMQARELRDREQLRKCSHTVLEYLDSAEPTEDQMRCSYCNTLNYLSSLTCRCGSKYTCLDHGEHLCQCDPSTLKMRLRFTDAQLGELIQKVKGRL